MFTSRQKTQQFGKCAVTNIRHHADRIKDIVDLETKLTRDFEVLTKQLEQEGWFTPSPTHLLYRLSEVVLLYLAGILLVAQRLWWPLGLALLGLAQGRCGWLMHEGYHRSLTTHPRVDKYLTEMFGALGCGLSGAWWRENARKVAATLDIETLPVKILWWQLVAHPIHVLRTANVREACWLAVRSVSICSFLSCTARSYYTAAASFIMYNVAAAVYFFGNLALTQVRKDPRESAKNLLTSTAQCFSNIAPTSVTTWWMGYQNYVIERSLFPSMPHHRFPQLSRRMKEFFEAHGLHYNVRGYLMATLDTAMASFPLGPILRTLSHDLEPSPDGETDGIPSPAGAKRPPPISISNVRELETDKYEDLYNTLRF